MQEEIIQSVLAGRDTLALLPTGGGKSICFQVPALAREGICIVVSPLIALMKDQVQNLQRRNIPAAAVYSGMSYTAIDRILDNCVYGQTKLLYLSPERLTTDLARERIRRMPVNLLAVDEAHCISQWGYDFRPPYLQIAEIRELLPEAPVLALTATATPEVVNDIQDKLAFRRKNVFQQSFTRSNLAYVVLQEEGKQNKLLDIVRKVPGTGIVYVRSRRRTKEIAYLLRKKGVSADYYHAGLSPEERSRKQEAWINDQYRIMVSTNAFGMGIDKPDVRTVVHMELPDSLEAYFQEAGRAGRDGKKAYAVLLYNQNDRRSLERNFELSFPGLSELRQVYRALGSYFQLAVGAGAGQSFEFDIIDFARTYQLDPVKSFNCLKILEQEGWLVITEAVFQPSTLMIKVSKDELYDYQLRHPKLDRILKSILRTYQGAFTQAIHLRESQLARFLNIPPAELQQGLELLHKDGIVRYQPQTDQPQLFFTRERVDAGNLTIDQEAYNFRKNRQLERIKAAIAYAETPVCRSRQLLHYFGEKSERDCGICDICLERSRGTLTSEDYEKLKEKIRRLLERESLRLEEIVDSFAPKYREKVLQTLTFLTEEGYVEEAGSRFVWRSSR